VRRKAGTVKALPKWQAAIEVNLRNKEMAEMLRDMLIEQCGGTINVAHIAQYSDGWILHIWVDDENKYDVVGRIYLMLNVDGTIVERRMSHLVETA